MELERADHVCVTSGETFIVFLSSENDGIPVVILFEKSKLKIVYLVEYVITLLNADTQMSSKKFQTRTPSVFTIVCAFRLKTELLQFYRILYSDVSLAVNDNYLDVLLIRNGISFFTVCSMSYR